MKKRGINYFQYQFGRINLFGNQKIEQGQNTKDGFFCFLVGICQI